MYQILRNNLITSGKNVTKVHKNIGKFKFQESYKEKFLR